MSNVTAQVVKSMYNHLIASYSPEEVKDILVAKYPEMEGEIELLMDPSQYGEDVARVAVTDEVIAAIDAEVEATEVPKATKADLLAAVKAATAKPKKEKAPKVEKSAKPKAEKAPKAESKADQARALYQASIDRSRKAMIELFVAELGMSKAMASTYFYACKK
jgi:hypothetical protein